MGAYKPLHITSNATGLVQSREEFILPHDAYPVLQNAFVWRERIKRKQGCKKLGRLRRKFSAVSIGNSSASPWTFNLFSSVSPAIPKGSTQPNAEIEAGSVVIVVSTDTFTDQGNGTLRRQDGNLLSTINYITGSITLVMLVGTTLAATATFNYFPALPAMGIRPQETANINLQTSIFFDTVYAYIFTGTGFQEYLPLTATTWSGSDSNFFWSTNYWTSAGSRLFWVTNFSGTAGDPIRYTDGASWTNFAPQIDAAGNLLTQCLAMLPYRGRLVVFNTFEGMNLAGSTPNPQRIRWAAVGSPIPTMLLPNTWRDDIPGQGGFLDIPTSESIISVGFVRDNLVIYCERSTWQLRYTGRSIQPFIIEKVNSELGAESTFSAVQFDTSLVGIGDKGVVSCDSYKSERIDVKIPDLVFSFNNDNQGPQRVCGFRDFFQRIAYWMYPYIGDTELDVTYPNRRLIYNYENDSWAIYIDSFTCLGNFQPLSGITWLTAGTAWQNGNFPWNINTKNTLQIAGGNQQGFISILDQLVLNDPTLAITAFASGANNVTIPNHNIEEGQIISISNIPIGSPYAVLNGGIYYASVIDANTIDLYSFDVSKGDFEDIVTLPTGTYIGGGRVAFRDNFVIQSKKFNYMDKGQNIQLGFIDILMPATDQGAITLNVLLNYNETDPINITPQNINPSTGLPDAFFNSIVSTSGSQNIVGTKYMQRVFCPIRGNFITIVWTLSPAQMAGSESDQDVQIDAQVLWIREAGRFTNN